MRDKCRTMVDCEHHHEKRYSVSLASNAAKGAWYWQGRRGINPDRRGTGVGITAYVVGRWVGWLVGWFTSCWWLKK
jgi:hypothetical protein